MEELGYEVGNGAVRASLVKQGIWPVLEKEWDDAAKEICRNLGNQGASRKFQIESLERYGYDVDDLEVGYFWHRENRGGVASSSDEDEGDGEEGETGEGQGEDELKGQEE